MAVLDKNPQANATTLQIFYVSTWQSFCLVKGVSRLSRTITGAMGIPPPPTLNLNTRMALDLY